jgi:selenide,water dikinase
VHAVTDVTGYGLAGHGWEMAERGGVQIVVDTGNLNTYPGALDGGRSAAYARAAIRAIATTSPGIFTRRPAQRARPCAWIRRRPAASSQAIDPAAVSSLSDMWWRVGEVVAGDPAIVLR